MSLAVEAKDLAPVMVLAISICLMPTARKAFSLSILSSLNRSSKQSRTSWISLTEKHRRRSGSPMVIEHWHICLARCPMTEIGFDTMVCLRNTKNYIQATLNG